MFVSSTLRELEAEHAAVRAAIERLHLAPVMFELGARPHPPRELYRSYLEQSDIFIGLYWERYGWVAPGEEISGLEDEYRLSTALPSLIYLKEPADREPRLSELLDRIRDDDRASYRSFETPEELSDLIVGDLATLLAERFDASAAHDAAATATPVPGIPAPYTSLVDRETARRAIAELLATPDERVLSIVGPGGVGKSRVAIEVAMAAAGAGREVAFALLESVPSAERVGGALARAMGVRNTGDAPLVEKILAAVGERPLLLVVDNMEHLLDAAPLLMQLVTGTPRLQLLVTSRSPLRIRAEHVYELAPLDLPPAGVRSPAEAERSAAVQLFVRRAVAARRAFRLTPGSTGAVVGICTALDGMPLAIELAAARVRTLSAQQILARLDSALTLLADGARPARTAAGSPQHGAMERRRQSRCSRRRRAHRVPPPVRRPCLCVGAPHRHGSRGRGRRVDRLLRRSRPRERAAHDRQLGGGDDRPTRARSGEPGIRRPHASRSEGPGPCRRDGVGAVSVLLDRRLPGTRPRLDE